MQNFISNLTQTLNAELDTIDSEEPEILKKAEKSVHTITNALTKLKAFVISYKFASQEDEIHFFKVTKPAFFSRLVYFMKVLKIESKCPTGGIEARESYYRNEMMKLTAFFQNHNEFYQYYRTKKTNLDDRYFVHGQQDLLMYMDSLMFYVDSEFSTSHDYVVSKIIAYDNLAIYLQNRLNGKSDTRFSGHEAISQRKWTAAKISLGELSYAMYLLCCVDNGACDIVDIAECFEKLFNVELKKDIHRMWTDIKSRENPTKFLDALKEALLNKLKQDDE